MIDIENISISFGNHCVLDGLSLSLPLNCIHGLVGMNGAGKTTLLNIMAGYTRAGPGTIMMNGVLLKRDRVAFLETDNFFFSNITGREYLGLFNGPDGGADVDAWNSMFRLPLDQVIDSYSSGMKKKLALIGVLRQDKPLVILDEPFNGLDMESSRLLGLIIGRLKERGKTVLITSHILGSLTGICDHIYLLANGKITLSRNKDEFAMLEQEIFKDVDLGYIDLVQGIL